MSLSKFLILLTSFCIASYADIYAFYHKALDTLVLKKQLTLEREAARLRQEAIASRRYGAFRLDAAYSDTRADLLPHHFETIDIALTDNLDLFNKKRYAIASAALDLRAKKSQLDSIRERLFRSLVAMIASYRAADAKWRFAATLYREEAAIYRELRALRRQGGVSDTDLWRFKNSLVLLKTKIIAQKAIVRKMRRSLRLYAPDEKIPALERALRYSRKAFCAFNPRALGKKIEADQSKIAAKALHDRYLPEFHISVGYEKLGDPTSYGDNYSLGIGMQMPLNRGDLKESEALRLRALRMQSELGRYDLQRAQEYITLAQDIQSAQKQMKLLEQNFRAWLKHRARMKNAYLKRLIDFNSYEQVLAQTLLLQERIVDLRYRSRKEATILNGVASGKIYE